MALISCCKMVKGRRGQGWQGWGMIGVTAGSSLNLCIICYCRDGAEGKFVLPVQRFDPEC